MVSVVPVNDPMLAHPDRTMTYGAVHFVKVVHHSPSPFDTPGADEDASPLALPRLQQLWRDLLTVPLHK